jgi:hypothetical protein
MSIQRDLAIALLALTPALAWAADAPRPREVNVTSDSAPGWVPTVEDEQAAETALARFLAADDAGRDTEAYAAIIPFSGQDTPEAYVVRRTNFRKSAGPVRAHRVVKVTWTKDPPASQGKAGVYVAMDLVHRYAEVDRDCGYIVLYRPPAGGGFRVARVEENILDNAAARVIARDKGEAAVDAVWAKLSARCPNYPRAMTSADIRGGGPLPESPRATDYPSVSAALAALKAKPGVTVRTENGWTIADDSAALTVWSFAPPGDPAYPSVVKRWVTQENGAVNMQMSVQCEATKSPCDDLVRRFEKLNQAVAARVRR